jgi:hypothetical protein
VQEKNTQLQNTITNFNNTLLKTLNQPPEHHSVKDPMTGNLRIYLLSKARLSNHPSVLTRPLGFQRGWQLDDEGKLNATPLFITLSPIFTC